MSEENNVISFQKKRNENIEKKRRSFERVLFSNFLGAYTEIHQDGLNYPVSLIDISKDGCLFRIPWSAKADKKLPQDQEITLRMYFTKHSYIPVVVSLKRATEYIENGSTYMDYGCEFNKSLPSFKAMEEFISFMYSFAEHSVIDRGDTTSYFL